MSNAITCFTICVVLNILSNVKTQTDLTSKSATKFTSSDTLTTIESSEATAILTIPTTDTIPAEDSSETNEEFNITPTEDGISRENDEFDTSNDISEIPHETTQESDEQNYSSEIPSETSTILTEEYSTEETDTANEGSEIPEEVSHISGALPNTTVGEAETSDRLSEASQLSTEASGSTVEESTPVVGNDELGTTTSDTKDGKVTLSAKGFVSGETEATSSFINDTSDTETTGTDTETDKYSQDEKSTSLERTKVTLVAKENDDDENESATEDVKPAATSDANVEMSESSKSKYEVTRGRDDYLETTNFNRNTLSDDLWGEAYWVREKDVAWIFSYVRDLSERFPKTVSLVEVGYTDGGLALYAVEVSHKVYSGATIVIDAGMDATDTFGVCLAIYILHELIEKQSQNLLTISGVTIVVVPLVNPDNYKRLMSGADAQPCKETLFHDWKIGTPNPASGCPSIFFAHPETQTLSAYYLRVKDIKLYISIGSGIPMISLPYGYKTGHSKRTLRMAENLKKVIDYDKSIPRVKICPIHECFNQTQGTPVDWHYDYLGTQYSLYLSLPRGLNGTKINLRVIKLYYLAIRYAILELQLTDGKIARAIYDECSGEDKFFTNMVFITCTFLIVNCFK